MKLIEKQLSDKLSLQLTKITNELSTFKLDHKLELQDMKRKLADSEKR